MSRRDDDSREWAAFEKGLILGCALGNGAALTTQEVADLLGYHGLRRGYNGAYMALIRSRIVDQDEQGRWILCWTGGKSRQPKKAPPG